MSVAQDWAVRRHLDGELITVADVISPAERDELLGWATAMEPFLMDNGPGRRFQRVERLAQVPAVHAHVRRRIEAILRLPEGSPVEPMFGWYVSLIAPGGQIHTHQDAAQPGQRHLRCNLFLQTAEAGGRPVVDAEPIDVADRALLAFFPSEKPHGSEVVEGSRRRAICSFGYLVPESYALPG